MFCIIYKFQTIVNWMFYSFSCFFPFFFILEFCASKYCSCFRAKSIHKMQTGFSLFCYLSTFSFFVTQLYWNEGSRSRGLQKHTYKIYTLYITFTETIHCIHTSKLVFEENDGRFTGIKVWISRVSVHQLMCT